MLINSYGQCVLMQVISNPVTGIDVGIWDSITRDSYMLGMDIACDHDRCIQNARVLTADGRKQICYREKVELLMILSHIEREQE
jgi:HD superfamily phosphohydrolase